MVPVLTCAMIALTGAGGELPANGGFEVGQGPQLADWGFECDAGQATTERREDGAPEGVAYARVAQTGEGQADLRPVAGFTTVTPGATYLLTAQVRASNVADRSHAIELQWFGATGFLSRSAGQARVGDRWVRVAVGPVRAPEGAATVIPLLRCYGVGTYDFDDVRLSEVAGMPVNVLSNPGFEADADGDGLPDGWTTSPAGATLDTGMAASGTCSIRTARESADSPPAFVRQAYNSVEPGRVYEFSAATRCDSFGREFRIAVEWWNGETLVSAAELRDQTFEAWQRKRVTATCPPEATRAEVVLELASTGTVWFDDVALSPSEVLAEASIEPTIPNPRGLVRKGVDGDLVKLVYTWTSAVPGATCTLITSGAAGDRVMPLEDRHGEAVVDLNGTPLGQTAVRIEVRTPEDALLAADEATVDLVAPDSHGVFFREDHIALVDGKPWFPIGVCTIQPTDEEAAGLAAVGFNMLATSTASQGTPEEMRALLDRAAQLGIYVLEWNNGWVHGGIASEAREAALRKMAENAGDHPAFLGLMCDEAIWNGVPLRDVMDGYRIMRRLMPTRLFWQNQAPRNTIEDLARYCRAADVTGMDIYPVDMPDHSDLPNKTLSVVGDEVRKNIATVYDAKPVWAILQGFGWFAWSEDAATHKRAPDWAETRFMAYDAILNGAVGIVYWGASYEKRDTEIWAHLRRIASELRDLTPALVAETKVAVPVVPEGTPVIAAGRVVDGKLFVLAVNESATERTATLTLPEGHTRLVRWHEDGPAPAIEGTTLTDTFAGYGVHVYCEE
jgi:hypothetical protein